jgi:hypothetical protein
MRRPVRPIHWWIHVFEYAAYVLIPYVNFVRGNSDL